MDPVEKGTKLVALLLLYSTSPAPYRPHSCRAHTAPITSTVGGCWGRGQVLGAGYGGSRRTLEIVHGTPSSSEAGGRRPVA